MLSSLANIIFQHVINLDEKTVKIEKPNEQLRVGIILNGNQINDSVFLKQTGVMSKLTNRWLRSSYYDKVYLLANVNDVWPSVGCAIVMPPTEENLEKVIGAIAAVGGLNGEDQVDILVLGHGGGDGKDHELSGDIFGLSGGMLATRFTEIVNGIPAPVQRVIRFTQCHAAAVSGLKLQDGNDLIITYSGEKKVEGPGEQKAKTEVNFLDSRDLGVIYDEDTDGDTVITNWEMYQAGIMWSVGHEMPFYRGSIFDPGINFVDYGFGRTPGQKPFTAELVEINNMASYVELLGKGLPRGMTVICYNVDPKQTKEAREQLQTLAKEYNGWVQFAFVDFNTSADVLNTEGIVLPEIDGPTFRFSFYAAGEMGVDRHMMNFDEMRQSLYNIRHGMNIQDELGKK